MKIAFFVKIANEYQILAKSHSPDKALEISNNIKADGVLLDMDTARILFTKALENPKESRNYVSSKTHQGIQRIPLEHIYYFQADQKYVTVHHQNGTLLIEDTLKELELEFSQQFIRVNRNLLVNMNEVEALEKDEHANFWLKIRNQDKLLPVSRRKLPEVRRKIK